MIALIFLLFGIVFLLVAISRIWLDAKPIPSQAIDSSDANNPDNSVPFNQISDGKNSVV